MRGQSGGFEVQETPPRMIQGSFQATAWQSNIGGEKMQLLGLENQLMQARQQLAALKKTARAQSRTQRDCDSSVCHQNFSRESVPVKASTQNQLETEFLTEGMKKAVRIQTRRPQAVRLVLHSNNNDCPRDAIFLEQTQSNADGLLLAVDKFLSTG